MKFLVYLFSLYVLLLSGVPCDTDSDCCADEIAQTSSNRTAKDHDHRPACPCSPFFACGACHSIVIPTVQIKLPGQLPTVENLYFFYITPSLPDFPASIWQPPQLA
ncbi:hypothetical protein SAMN04488505_103244 [Chitinophaga rupis]|uniref:Uncharacterized protein n=1 Tax=Chitinophaga rupis TaxID=573321 RepID=A0A1H7V8I3_9BACT|nr:DUF6660 family protein [Chitinophaga rupis]SEM05248.1 hypothetical protein SAMN04488505_103244 [Chitinophaga rupis]